MHYINVMMDSAFEASPSSPTNWPRVGRLQCHGDCFVSQPRRTPDDCWDATCSDIVNSVAFAREDAVVLPVAVQIDCRQTKCWKSFMVGCSYSLFGDTLHTYRKQLSGSTNQVFAVQNKKTRHPGTTLPTFKPYLSRQCTAVLSVSEHSVPSPCRQLVCFWTGISNKW